MQKKSGFTLIELMIVMVIIAILATVGISTYTSYISKARDTDRVQDIKSIEQVIISEMTSNGNAPTLNNLKSAIKLANNGTLITDPQSGSLSCADTSNAYAGCSTNEVACNYWYAQCDGGSGYVLRTKFESKDQATQYDRDNISTTNTISGNNTLDVPRDIGYYDIGKCNAVDVGTGGNIVEP